MTKHALAHKPLAQAHTAAPKLNDSFEQTKLHLKSASVTHASHGSSGSIVRTLIALVIVVAVIYGLTWIVKKLKHKDGSPLASGDGLERIAQLSLGTNKSVVLVRVGSQLHLLGVAEHSVTGIRSFDEDEALEFGLPVTAPGTVYTTSDGDTASGFPGVLDTLKRFTQR